MQYSSRVSREKWLQFKNLNNDFTIFKTTSFNEPLSHYSMKRDLTCKFRMFKSYLEKKRSKLFGNFRGKKKRDQKL